MPGHGSTNALTGISQFVSLVVLVVAVRPALYELFDNFIVEIIKPIADVVLGGHIYSRCMSYYLNIRRID